MGQECATDKDDKPKNPLSELMDLSETWVQVDGPLIHLTLFTIANKRAAFYTDFNKLACRLRVIAIHSPMASNRL